MKTSLFLIVLLLPASVSAELPPDIMVDRLLVQANRHIDEGAPFNALSVMREIAAIKEEHDIELPHDFYFRYGRAARSAGLTQEAIDHFNMYLLTAGREGDRYQDALVLLDEAEQTLQREQAEIEWLEWERQREEARLEWERQREEARLKANDKQAQRQIEESKRVLPRDELSSGGVGPEMVRIAEGAFEPTNRSIGWDKQDEIPMIEFNKPFALSRYEVTRGEFRKFVKSTRYKAESKRKPKYGCGNMYSTRYSPNSYWWKRPGFDQTDTHPVVCVSIRDAIAYADWLSRETGQTYRLPSAAEWEYAARAGTDISMWFVYEIITNLSNYSQELMGVGMDCTKGNIEDQSTGNEYATCNDGARHTAPVGQYPPNAIGLHDMAGNVSERVMTCNVSKGDDRWAVSLNPLPEHPDHCDSRIPVIKGASWLSGVTSPNYSELRPRAFRLINPPIIGGYDTIYVQSSYEDLGFRLLRVLDD